MIISNALLSVMSTNEMINWGITALVAGLGSVFAVLILLIFFIKILTALAKEKRVVLKVNNKKTANTNTDEDEILAAITAAVSYFSSNYTHDLSDSQKTVKKYAIKSYKRIDSKRKINY